MTPITLAAIYNLSGGQSGLDVPSWQGARLAAAEANERGGVLGRPVELVLGDSGTDPDALGAMTSAALEQHPDISALFGLSDTDMVLAAATWCAAVERLFVTSGATSPHLPQQAPIYLYLACFGDNVQAAAAAEYAFNELGARRAAVLYRRNDTFTELLQGYFAARFAELGGSAAATASYETMDELARAAAELPAVDVVFFSAAPDDVIDGIGRLRDAGITLPIVGGDSFALGREWHHHPALDGVHFATHAFIDPRHPDPAVAAFVEAYARAYPGEEAGAFAALGYDTARLVMAAVDAAGSGEPMAVLHALPRLGDFEGLTGTIRYEGGSHIPAKSVTILRAGGGEVTLAAQFTPSGIPAP